jgi:hypothetical protein
MRPNIVIELLKTFNDDEVKRFDEYLQSPFFNKSKVLITLYRALVKHHPDYINPALEKPRLFKKIYPGKIYHEQNLRNRMAELSELIKDFIALIQADKNQTEKKHNFIDGLIKRKKYRLAEQNVLNLMQSLKEINILDSEYFLHKLRTLERGSLIYLVSDDKSKKPYQVNVEKSQYLINYFLVYLLQVLHDIINRDKTHYHTKEFVVAHEFMKNFDWKTFLKKLEENNYEQYNLLSIYYNMYMTLISDDVRHYLNLKESVFKEFDTYGREDQFNFVAFLLHTIYNNPALKTKKFHKEGFEINKIALEKNIYFLDKYTTHFPAILFWSISNNAILVNEIDWLEKFVDEYTPKLRPEEQNNMFNYAMSKIYSRRKNYEQSLDCLSKIDYSKMNNELEKINLKLLYLVNYYELGAQNQLFSLIDSYKHFLSGNKKIPETSKEGLRNFLKYISIASRAKFDNKPLDYADYKEAKESKSMVYRNWLYEKMEELLK